MERRHQKRTNKLIKPRLQLKVIVVFLCISILAVLTQTALLASALLTPAEAGAVAADGSNGVVVGNLDLDILYRNTGLALAILVPCTFVFGALVTHRIAGPVYRFETYLTDLAAGRVDGPCRIRKDDELHELCAAINAATESIRAQNEASRDSDEQESSPRLCA